jgi:hypothetical protein
MESLKDVEINIKTDCVKEYNPECPCCMEVPKKGRIIFDCRHLMCTGCFMMHNKKSNNCPICRVVYRENNEQLPRLDHRRQPVRHPPRLLAPQIHAPRLLAPQIRDLHTLTPRSLRREAEEWQAQRDNFERDAIAHQRRQIRTNREQRLRDAPPLGAHRDDDRDDDEPTTDYKNLAIVVLADIFVMAIWLLRVNMYS